MEPNPAAAAAIETLAAKGYPLLLTTMPMFPPTAVRHRLAWAGIRPEAFARLTHYENSRTVKPRPLYYAENLAAAGVDGADVLMVGNNTVEDLSFMHLGADGYLVTGPIDPAEAEAARTANDGGSLDGTRAAAHAAAATDDVLAAQAPSSREV